MLEYRCFDCQPRETWRVLLENNSLHAGVPNGCHLFASRGDHYDALWSSLDQRPEPLESVTVQHNYPLESRIRLLDAEHAIITILEKQAATERGQRGIRLLTSAARVSAMAERPRPPHV